MVLAGYRLIAARIALALWPAAVLARRQARSSSARPFHASDQQLTQALERASHRLPFTPTCLERAVALQRLLEFAGLDGRLVIGVRRAGETIHAHAWVEREGRRLVGGQTPDDYVPIVSR